MLEWAATAMNIKICIIVILQNISLYNFFELMLCRVGYWSYTTAKSDIAFPIPLKAIA